MHLEVQTALEFVISYLYNKLPRRRVNIFGEELEKALKEKFRGHWYPERPFKGSAFRCLKTGDPVDAVFEKAARESGVPIQDILENLPQELAVWVDPGEVSYRIGEKGTIKVLYSEAANEMSADDASAADKEVIKTFNPEAQCFRPIEAVTTSLGGLNISPKPPASPPSSDSSPPPQANSNGQVFKNQPTGSPSPVAPSFIPRSTAPLTFTTATFAQTKFGSTKLKTNSKRANRMSPTEFSNYIKQRAIQQQQQQQQQQAAVAAAAAAAVAHGGIHSGSPGRSLSPHHPSDYLFHQQGFYRGGMFDNYHHADLYPKFPYMDHSQYFGGGMNTPNSQQQSSNGSDSKHENFTLGTSSYSPNQQYQHLLVAN